MYELVLRIDVGEVANSSFHQTQRESELSDVFSFFFPSLLWSCHVFAVWVKKPQNEKKKKKKKRGCVSYCSGHACVFSDGDISNPLMSCLKRSQRQKVLDILFPFLARGVLYHTLFGLF